MLALSRSSPIFSLHRRFSIESGDAVSFDRIVSSRRCAVRFNENRCIPPSLLRECLAATIRSPSSFNMTPYRIVLAESPRFRARVADCMIGGANAARVKTAPVSVIFFADCDAMQRVDDVAARESRAGARPAAYLRSLRATAALFASSRGASAAASACGGGGRDMANAAVASVGHLLKSVGVAAAVSRLSRVPLPTGSIDSGASWAHKNTGMAAMSFLLAAASRGLATYPMEGFDSSALVREMSFSQDDDDGQRWQPALVIATGWDAAVNADSDSALSTSRSQAQAAQQRRRVGAESTRPLLSEMVTIDGATNVLQ
jgi:nitroreductase